MGPSVCFVFGALQQPIGTPPSDEAAGREAVKKLLVSLRSRLNTSPDPGVRIQWCLNIKAYVATAMPFVEGLAWDIDGCGDGDLDCVLEHLWDLYGRHIMAAEFSREDGVWREFNPEEIHTIEALLGTTS